MERPIQAKPTGTYNLLGINIYIYIYIYENRGKAVTVGARFGIRNENTMG